MPGDAGVRAQAARFLADIELNIRGNQERANELLERAVAAAREVGDPWTIARTLLIAGWGPYWRGDAEGGRAIFTEALEVARANPEGDGWAEARALISLAAMVPNDGDEEEGFALASEGLVVAEALGDRFSIATARDQVAASLRRMMRLDDALQHVDAAVESFRELGARWELASALTSRGIVHRLARRADLAARDLREAYRLCRELKDRSMVSWTARSYARALTDLGETGKARQVLEETAAVTTDDDGWSLPADIEIRLAEGDHEGALDAARTFLATASQRGAGDGVGAGVGKDLATATWYVGAVVGEDAAGGTEEVERARALLERLHARQMLVEPELVPGRVTSAGTGGPAV
jgi:tetratricopeptide (TPR) repeat protein